MCKNIFYSHVAFIHWMCLMLSVEIVQVLYGMMIWLGKLYYFEVCLLFPAFKSNQTKSNLIRIIVPCSYKMIGDVEDGDATQTQFSMKKICLFSKDAWEK